MSRSLGDERRMVERFFKAEIRNLESATTAVVQTNARTLKRIGFLQLRRFRRGRNSTGAFHKAVKVYDLKPEGTLGPASYTRFGVKFIGVFQEGATISGKPTLIVLLRTGEDAGFKRISKGNPWSKVWSKIQGKTRIVPINNGKLVIYQNQGRSVPIYFITRQVKEPKLLSIYEEADKLSQDMPSQITRLMNS
jgi:Family of unknown function (DUF6441)